MPLLNVSVANSVCRIDGGESGTGQCGLAQHYEVANPVSEVAKPASEVANPASEVANPASEVADPASEITNPASGEVCTQSV